MPKDITFVIKQCHPHVTNSTERFQIGIVWEELSHIVWDVDQVCALDNRLTGRARKLVFVIRDRFAIEPESERAQPVCFFEVLSDPGSIRVQGSGQAFYQS